MRTFSSLWYLAADSFEGGDGGFVGTQRTTRLCVHDCVCKQQMKGWARRDEERLASPTKPEIPGWAILQGSGGTSDIAL